MSPTTGNNLRAPLSRRSMPRPVARFFLLAYAITWLCQLPLLLQQWGAGIPPGVAMAPLVLGAVGPSLAAVVCAWKEGGRAGLSGLLSPHPAPAGWGYAPLALCMPAALHLLGLALLALAGGSLPATLLYTPLTPEHRGIAVLAPLGEELGWRGYALRRLLPAQGPVRASLVLGVAWTFWHLPALCLPGVPWWSWALSLVFITSLSVLMTALHLRSGGSVLVAWAAHLGIHLDNVSRAHMSGGGAAPLLVTTIVALVAAVITARWMQMQTRSAATAQPAPRPG
ncbi:CPBP family intramembrane glutamic endopeptidase [Sorangium sp. So ce204]|uniref:CPBP family intramembrane glutamic endopeptidase n=1 Tax=Sorangium sp. So ce204 TaxID=3133288 RepID=UPI003F5D603F